MGPTARVAHLRTEARDEARDVRRMRGVGVAAGGEPNGSRWTRRTDDDGHSGAKSPIAEQCRPRRGHPRGLGCRATIEPPRLPASVHRLFGPVRPNPCSHVSLPPVERPHSILPRRCGSSMARTRPSVAGVRPRRSRRLATASFTCAPRSPISGGHNPTGAEIVVIHELLHTLGLGENPPSSRRGPLLACATRRCGAGVGGSTALSDPNRRPGAFS